MSQQLINQYLNEIDRLRKFSGSVTEGVISEAFKDLLKTWARQLNWQFAAQYEFASAQRSRIRPDGTIFHSIGLPFGYWEAKDTADVLDVEISKKLAKGYPQDNIIFENSNTAVLIQDRREVYRCPMNDSESLLKLLNLFFDYERAEIREFRKAVEEFKTYLPFVLDALRERIDTAYAENVHFRAAAHKFLDTCKETINPTLSEADVREMLIQHILTEEIFTQVFNEGDFHHENNIAKELYALEGKFFTGAVKKETLKGLEPYYAAIRANAAQITSHSEKQTFLKVIYENFYKVYDTKKADRLGVVYTPNEIVKFMIESTDWLCERHFDKNLIDPHVEILDPATGTGTFICELLEYFRGEPKKLAHKYKNELHANEVAILPYYVANLNIESTYAAISGQFAEFPNLCFVDTLDNVEGLGIRAGHQHDMFAALSDENIERVKRQNARKISVVIGNPPYNPRQEYYDQRNANRSYNRIDQTIRDTYIRLGTAQNKNTVYDMYVRFIRWASDRLADDGVIAFVTNRNFVSKAAFDGFRKAVAKEFSEIWLVDLGGDVRDNPKLSGTSHNVFGIQTGIVISFFVKKRGKTGAVIRYLRRPENELATDKLSFLSHSKMSDARFETILPNKTGQWLEQSDNDWGELPAVCSKDVKAFKKNKSNAIFRLFSLGNASHRDEWVYDRSKEHLERKIKYFISAYERARSLGENAATDISWDRELSKYLTSGVSKQFSQELIIRVNYRPFHSTWFYFDRHLNAMTYQLPDMFPPNAENKIISFSSVGARAPFCVSSAACPVDLHYGAASDGYQVLPLYRYTANGERVDNITDWGLKQFHKAYGKDGRLLPGEGETSAEPIARGEPPASAPAQYSPFAPAKASPQEGGRGKQRTIGKEDIFHYVYAVLHDPIYRETYALNLKHDFPRIPFYPDFWIWATWGERLMALHIGYESVEQFDIARADTPDEGARAAGVLPKPILKADRDNGVIRIDTETTLSGIPKEAFDYHLGNRSGLEWILDQYKEKTPKDPTIREKFNTYRFADYKEHVIDLIARVTTVSLETIKVVNAMRLAKRR
ncbi:type ISP restriction/modification enzyme [Rhizobium lentis]|uniref:site-specific DNA-methyltransferase (adenine-specific) n=1 Tax=Rhizobium lentis TaxID=1138194 RepID=A0A9Q3MEP8_9HYPH|nr:type ISP restriction/modification enzyme [Rhizobium lentis]MBX5026791.1 N-6 DNA methylase [Rhizobium lentis]MBX5068589.1 N-6 DNA methylase [Rhizobium lentis]MBX5080616.1 N-6 DNA methylase [Rhizobium lentis]QSW92178.1 N-6 DNA methylase [Rhizobium lentis]